MRFVSEPLYFNLAKLNDYNCHRASSGPALYKAGFIFVLSVLAWAVAAVAAVAVVALIDLKIQLLFVYSVIEQNLEYFCFTVPERKLKKSCFRLDFRIYIIKNSFP